jgi:hypothetical protein
MSLLDLLFQFLSRLAYGLALAMSATSEKVVPSGFYRNHSYVLLGMNVLASLIAFGEADDFGGCLALTAAVVSYFSSVAWLYEKPRMGRAALVIVCISALVAASYTVRQPPDFWAWVDVLTSGYVLGMMIGAMFLGHYYLNSPSMRLEPLRALVGGIFIGIAARAIAAGVGLVTLWAVKDSLIALDWALLSMRWLCGLAAPLVVAWMAWQTLKIPNTQSATGILYVGVITVFLGELAALVLSSKLGHPL